MVKATPEQRRSLGRVMHENEHQELESGPGGKGGPVKSRQQAIAIVRRIKVRQCATTSQEPVTDEEQGIAQRNLSTGERRQRPCRRSR